MSKVIYLIDDDDDVRDVISFVLTEENYQVEAFARADLALEKLKSIPFEELPGLIFVDYNMPYMSGMEFIYNLKEFHPDTLGKIPLVLCSGQGDMGEGFAIPPEVKIFPKPMELEELLALTKNILKA